LFAAFSLSMRLLNGCSDRSQTSIAALR